MFGSGKNREQKKERQQQKNQRRVYITVNTLDLSKKTKISLSS